MNKKGFTLTEIIGSVIILMLILLLSFPIILNLVKKEETKLNEANITLIKTAASQYTNEFENAFPRIIGNSYCITIEELIKKDFLINHNEEFSLDTNVLVTINQNKKYEYEISPQCEASEIKPNVVVKNLNGVFNDKGWANKNFYVAIVGSGSAHYKCVSVNNDADNLINCNPDILMSMPSSDVLLSNDGYIKVCAKAINNYGESEIVCSDKFKLDTISPTKPVISVSDITNLKKKITLVTPSTDSLSGLSHYEYAINSINNIDGATFIETDDSVLELTLNSDDKYIHYRAVDNAGNKSEVATLSLGKGNFEFAINGYNKIDIVNIELPNNSIIKYLKGNKTAAEVINNGTNITTSKYFTSLYNDIYTVTAINNNEEVITKKIYVHNFEATYFESHSVILNGITKIGSTLNYGATATASFNSPNLTINVSSADEHISYYCSDSNYTLNGEYCEGSYGASVGTYSCVHWGGDNFDWAFTQSGETCMDGSSPEWELLEGDLGECSKESPNGSFPIYGTCTESYPADTQPYYRYTIGVEVE